nr:GNAT family N-acetyltransferase [Cytophagales bacterium]
MEQNVEIHRISSEKVEEFDALLSVFEKAFEMEPFVRLQHTYLQHLLKDDHFLAIVASAEKTIIGGLTVYILDQYYAQKKLAYIYDLAVLPSHQRQGVGKKLIEFTTSYCRERGFEEVFVQAEGIDKHAIDFYRATDPTGEQDVVHFQYLLKPKTF